MEVVGTIGEGKFSLVRGLVFEHLMPAITVLRTAL